MNVLKISCSAHFFSIKCHSVHSLNTTGSPGSQEIHIHSEQVIGKNECHDKQAAREMIECDP